MISVSWGPSVEGAYFNTEIIDAYCRILILSKLLGRVNYFSEQDNSELMEFKKRINLGDPRIGKDPCTLCGPSIFGTGYGDFVPEPYAFRAETETGIGDAMEEECACHVSPARKEITTANIDDLVRTITDKVMASLAGSKT